MTSIEKDLSLNLKIQPTSFLKKRIEELAGLVLLAFMALLSVAFFTYNASDASWNSASTATVINIVGVPGAIISDLLIQMIGIANFLLVIVPSFWGIRLLTHSSIEKPFLRLVFLTIGVILFSSSVARISAPEFWSISSGLGGTLGPIVFDQIFLIVEPLSITSDILGYLLAFTSTITILWCFGAGWGEWTKIIRGILRHLKSLLILTGRLSLFGLRMMGSGLKLTAKFANNNRDNAGPRMEPVVAQNQSTINRSDQQKVATDLESTTEFSGRGLVSTTLKRDKGSRKAGIKKVQENLNLQLTGEYALPQLSLLAYKKEIINSTPDRQTLEANARMLETVLQDFGVKGEIVEVRTGPVVTLYELEPAPGTKSSRVIGLADDIARSMSAVSVRVAVVPGRNVIGIELPNARREMVFLRQLFETDEYSDTNAKLPIALGKDIGGAPVVVDLAKMPHLLIAGTTGSGKSVAVNTMILSLLYKLSPEQCRMIMIDPKMLELSIYDNIPHLLSPVVTDPKKAVVALKWTVREMESRYRAMSKLGVRNIEGYNARLADARRKGEVLKRRVQTGFDAETGKPVFEDQPLDLTPIPFIVVVIDEVADLMLVAGKDIEGAVQRLAQMARAAGIHVIMATQRPSVDVITGTIKANFPTRISFQVTSKIDSRTILGEQGAEQLLGQGDMLHMAGGGRVTRVHGPFVSDGEVEDVVLHLRAQGEPEFNESITEEDEVGDPLATYGLGAGDKTGDSGDELYDQAIAIVSKERKASTSFIQRHLKIGYNRAATIIERMEADGVVSSANHVGKREVLVSDHSET
jgi:S-DNA-T family DNA segregation ATPase FtsK/SpoIIIE